ncbi:MAG: hypothetical protein H7Y03_14920 [Chitinophagaceae bacterium]|nr:hypothetical protein [Chitinophagaceae bacterium]
MYSEGWYEARFDEDGIRVFYDVLTKDSSNYQIVNNQIIGLEFASGFPVDIKTLTANQLVIHIKANIPTVGIAEQTINLSR